MKTKIGIKPEHMQSTADHLQKILANEFVLYTKTRKAHWNVECPNFYDRHKFFEEQYSVLEQLVDDVAERIRTIGHYPIATLTNFLALTSLTEQGRIKTDTEDLIAELLNDHETIIIEIRELLVNPTAVTLDAGTVDFMTTLMSKHEKMAWILRAHLK